MSGCFPHRQAGGAYSHVAIVWSGSLAHPCVKRRRRMTFIARKGAGVVRFSPSNKVLQFQGGGADIEISPRVLLLGDCVDFPMEGRR